MPGSRTNYESSDNASEAGSGYYNSDSDKGRSMASLGDY